MQRIALISEHASPLAAPGGVDSGGQNVYVSQVSRELARHGYAVDIYTRRDAPALPDIIDWQPGIRVIHVTAGPAAFLPKEALMPHMKAFTAFVASFMQRQQLHYRLVHANFFMSGMVALQLKRSFGLPFVITFHALGRVRRLNQGNADGFPDLRFAIEESLMREAAFVIAECDQDLCDMCSLYQARPGNIAVVPCGFDPEEFWPMRDSARHKLGIGSSEFMVLQLGRMVPRKGVDNVIRALALLGQQGVHARLMIVGGERDASGQSSAELQRLAELAAALGVDNQLSFQGPQPRAVLREYYSAADVFVTTPWYEPFGITPLEAMACATPVIGSAVGGIRSTVMNGQTGYLVPPNDPAALASRLITLQRDPQLARRMGWTGLRRAHRYFTWHRVAAQLAAVYESVIQDSMHRLLTGLGEPEPMQVNTDTDAATGIAQ